MTVVQVLLVNVLTDGLPAIALARDPAAPQTMDRGPQRGDRLFPPRAWARLAAIGALGSGSVRCVPRRPGGRRRCRPDDGVHDLALAELALVFAVRSPIESAWSAPRNRYLLGERRRRSRSCSERCICRSSTSPWVRRPRLRRARRRRASRADAVRVRRGRQGARSACRLETRGFPDETTCARRQTPVRRRARLPARTSSTERTTGSSRRSPSSRAWSAPTLRADHSHPRLREPRRGRLSMGASNFLARRSYAKAEDRGSPRGDASWRGDAGRLPHRRNRSSRRLRRPLADDYRFLLAIVLTLSTLFAVGAARALVTRSAGSAAGSRCSASAPWPRPSPTDRCARVGADLDLEPAIRARHRGSGGHGRRRPSSARPRVPRRARESPRRARSSSCWGSRTPIRGDRAIRQARYHFGNRGRTVHTLPASMRFPLPRWRRAEQVGGQGRDVHRRHAGALRPRRSLHRTSAIFATTVTAGASDVPFGVLRLLGGLAFSLGLILVVVAGAELFTGNNLIVMAWASGRVKTMRVARNWTSSISGTSQAPSRRC